MNNIEITGDYKSLDTIIKANRLCAGIQSTVGSNKNIILVSISGEGLGKNRPTLAKGVQLMSLQDARKVRSTPIVR